MESVGSIRTTCTKRAHLTDHGALLERTGLKLRNPQQVAVKPRITAMCDGESFSLVLTLVTSRGPAHLFLSRIS